MRILSSHKYTFPKYHVIFTGFNQYKTIVKSLTCVEITEMMKRHQHITKLQSEIIKEKKLIDFKLDEAIAKHCYLEKKNQNINYCQTLSYPQLHLM